MTTATVILNPGTGGAAPLVDTLTTVDGIAAPVNAVAQMNKIGIGAASDFKTVSAAFPLPTGLIQPDVNTTGTISTTDIVVGAPTGTGVLLTGASTAGSFVFSAVTNGYTAWIAQITGLTTGTIYFEASADSTTGADGNWINVIGRQIGILNSLVTGNATVNGNWRGNLSAYKYFRLRSVGTLTGTPAILIRMSAGLATVFLNGSIPTGQNNIGAVTGTFFQTTQPISAASLPLPTGASTETTLAALNTKTVAVNTGAVVLATGAATIGAVNIAAAQTLATVSAVTAITNALPAGANSIGAVTNTNLDVLLSTRLKAADTLTAVTTVTTVSAVTAITNALPAGANSIGTVQVATPTAFSLSSAATTNATSVKATAGTVFQIVASNVGAAAAFLKIFNLATAPTVGTSVPFLTIPIPASGVVSVPFGTLGMRFGTGIALSITNLVADADATVIAAAQVKVAISYV